MNFLLKTTTKSLLDSNLLQSYDMSQLAALCGLSVVFRVDNTKLWTDVLARCSYVPVSYTNSMIEFYWEYQRCNYGVSKDLSLICYWDNKPVAIWPLSLSVKGGEPNLGFHGLPALPLLFTADCPEASRKRIIKKALNFANMIAETAGLTSWESAESFTDTNGLSEWHIESMARNAACSLTHELYVDLIPGMTDIKRKIRKSYKSLITAGLRIWSVNILDTANETIWNKFHQLHIEVSGRITRSDETWRIQFQEIIAQRAFLIYLLDGDGEMEGGGFFHFTQDEGLYAVAAYNRALFDKPLGHVVQYRAIEELKKRRVRWYKIGARPYRTEAPTPTDKEIAIGDFKHGFSSHLFPRYILTHPVQLSAKGH